MLPGKSEDIIDKSSNLAAARWKLLCGGPHEICGEDQLFVCIRAPTDIHVPEGPLRAWEKKLPVEVTSNKQS